jgi:hypothetical protein
MRWIRYVAVLSLLVLVAGCGESKDRAAEAEKIKQDLTAGFDVMFGKDKLKIVGYEKLDVAPDGDSYKATLTAVTILPNAGPDAPKIGDVTFNIDPKDADKYQITNLMLPSGVDIALADGQGKAKLEFGSQQFSGVWSKSLAMFLDMDAAYKNVQVTGDQGFKLLISDVAGKTSSTDKGNGLYDQTTSYSVKDIKVESPDGTFNISGISSSSQASGVNLAEVRKFTDQFNALMISSMENKPADQAVVDALKQMKAFFQDSSGKAEITGMSFKDTAGQEAFKMDKVTIDAGWFGFNQPKGKFDMAFRFDGISAPSAAAMPEAAMFGQFIPSKFGIGITLEDIPSADLWNAVVSVLSAPHGDPMAAETTVQAAGMQILQSAQQSGSTIKLNGWEYDSQSVKLKMGGSVKADTNAMMGATASLNLDLVGLDTIMGIAQMFSGGDPSATAPLEMLKTFSNRTTDSSGQPLDSFAVELANSGDVTINGKPFDPFAMPAQQ